MRRIVALIVVAVALLTATPAGATPPSPCLQALKAAEKMRAGFATFTSATQAYHESNSQALTSAAPSIAGFTAALNGYAANTRAYTLIVGSITADLEAARETYDAAAKRCRKA